MEPDLGGLIDGGRWQIWLVPEKNGRRLRTRISGGESRTQGSTLACVEVGGQGDPEGCFNFDLETFEHARGAMSKHDDQLIELTLGRCADDMLKKGLTTHSEQLFRALLFHSVRSTRRQDDSGDEGPGLARSG